MTASVQGSLGSSRLCFQDLEISCAVRRCTEQWSTVEVLSFLRFAVQEDTTSFAAYTIVSEPGVLHQDPGSSAKAESS